MNKLLKISLITIFMYLAIWISKCFICWELESPLNMILESGSYEQLTRTLIVSSTISYCLVIVIIIQTEDL